MAVQKSRVTRSRRGMRRSHDSLTAPTLTVDAGVGTVRRRHHISPEGYYKGRQVLTQSVDIEEESDEE